MLATLTSKGQVTLRKQIRDKFGLKAGSKRDFELLPDGTVQLRPAKRTALSIIGMLKRPGPGAAARLHRGDGRRHRHVPRAKASA